MQFFAFVSNLLRERGQEGKMRMRRVWYVVGVMVVSCLFTGGCGGGGESTATPDNLKGVQEATQKELKEITDAQAKTKAARRAK
jgi:Fe-S cluster biogenesis protein NfuA